MHYPQLMELKKVIPNVLSVAVIVIAVGWSYLRLFYHADVTELLTDTGFRFVNFIVRLAYCIAFWSIIDVVLPKLLPVKEFYNHSFWVYAMHINVGGIVAKLLFMVMPKYPIFAVANHILNTIITLAVISLIAILLKKKWRPAYDILSGSRG